MQFFLYIFKWFRCFKTISMGLGVELVNWMLHLLETSGLDYEPKYFKTKLREIFISKGKSYTYSSGELVQLIRL